MVKEVLYILSFCAILISSCKKDAPIYEKSAENDVEENIWVPVSSLKFGDKNILRARHTDRYIALATATNLVLLNDSLEPEKSFKTEYNSHSLYVKPHISNKAVIYASSMPTKQLHIFSLANTVTQYDFDISTFDTTIKNLAFVGREVPVCINNNGKMLVVATEEPWNRSGHLRSGYIHFLIFQLELNNDVWIPKFEKQEIYIKDTSEAFAKTSISISNINTDGRDFYVSMRGNYNETLQVTENAEVSAAYPMYSSYFLPVKDSTHILGFNRFNISWGYITNNTGYNVVDLNWQDLGFFRFAAIDNKVIAYYNHQMFLISLDRKMGRYYTTEIDNKGLPFLTTINDILVVDDKVFIATINGAYTKKLENFFTPKN